MSKEERGPGYWDVSRCMQEFERRGILVEWRLTSYAPKGGKEKEYHLHLMLDWYPVGAPSERRTLQCGGWGRGGLPSTLPTLMYQGLITLERRLDEAQNAAEQRAMF